MRSDWWPDWRGKTAVIAASGESLTSGDLDHVRGKAPLVVINTTWRLAPWADVLYACDANWWRICGPGDEFAGLRVIGKNSFPGCFEASVVPRYRSMIWTGTEIGGGGNGGFQALNLVALWGVSRILLLGFDCQGGHWHGPHPDGMTNPDARMMATWRGCFDDSAPVLADRGIKVVNCSRKTALGAFPRARLGDMI